MNPENIRTAVEFFLKHERKWEWCGEIPIAQAPLKDGFYRKSLYLKDEKYWPDEEEIELWTQGLISYIQNDQTSK